MQLVHSVTLAADGGSQTVQLDDRGNLVGEWYCFGEDVAYEFANQLIFSKSAQAGLGGVLGKAPGTNATAIVEALGRRFSSYWEIAEFVDAKGVPHERKVDFWP